MSVIVPNTVFEYTIDADGTFPNRKVDIPSFTEEIQASSIGPTLVSVLIVGPNCQITFATDLTEAEILILDGLVLAHTAATIGEPHMIPYIWQVKNPVANQTDISMKVMGLAGAVDDYNLMRPAVPVGLNIRLKNALTQGSITITILKNGVSTGKSKTITSADSRKKLWLLKTTDISYNKKDTIGLQYSTSSDMLPTGDNEVDINIEMSWTTL